MVEATGELCPYDTVMGPPLEPRAPRMPITSPAATVTEVGIQLTVESFVVLNRVVWPVVLAPKFGGTPLLKRTIWMFWLPLPGTERPVTTMPTGAVNQVPR